MTQQDEAGFEAEIFRQVNEHLRSNEQKEIALATAYFSVIGVVLAIVSQQISQPTALRELTLVSFALVIFGVGVHLASLWLRRNRFEYWDVARRHVARHHVAESMLPRFMRDPGPSQSALPRNLRLATSLQVLFLDNSLATVSVVVQAGVITAFLLGITWRIGLRVCSDLWTFAATTVVVGVVYSMILVFLNKWMVSLMR